MCVPSSTGLILILLCDSYPKEKSVLQSVAAWRENKILVELSKRLLLFLVVLCSLKSGPKLDAGMTLGVDVSCTWRGELKGLGRTQCKGIK